MEEFRSSKDVLDFAIEREQEAHDFYMGIAEKMERESMVKVFRDFAREEMGHKNRLEGVKAGNLLMPVKTKVMDLKIGDYLVEVEPSGEMDYQEALIVAMKKEKAAFRLYNDLADKAGEGSLRELFMDLAQQEAKHKLRFEIEYDENFLSEN